MYPRSNQHEAIIDFFVRKKELIMIMYNDMTKVGYLVHKMLIHTDNLFDLTI